MSAPVPEHERRLSLALRGCDHDSSPIRVLPEDVRACLQEVKGLRQSHVATNFIERTDRIAAIAAQRRMIAALYWRAGEVVHWTSRDLLMATAKAMEAAL